ncbi:MAG: oxygenase MpaB family protein [Pseudomonadota bacterium]|uniref:oxygenase MpaB family protein n=1 Tax=Alcanivorax sp. TaxID=1872427 RepID=UPI00243FC8A1|nr:oxygenase MpaB family protein [Alcanivorax sp.]MED5238052.1 oxygenase MpaB family protein [Pseudomonadota bacterium]MEE3321017.1 oxygenase MpaB family protein [Pseudomonadota bacterium]
MATPSNKKADPITLGPDSLAWTHAGDNLQLLMAGTTLLLQVSHPVVGAGVGDHSVFKEDPWGRLKRTTEWGLRLMYGGEQGSPQAGRDLRELHRNIKGADAKGRKYFALDPEAYAWVHMTTYYAMITTQRLFGDKPFTASEEAQLLQEWVQQGRVLGIRDQDMPHSVPAFWEYFNNMVENRLENTDTARYLLDVSLSRVKKPPQLSLMPDWLWKRLYRQLGKGAKLTTYATLPPGLRKKFHVHWTGRLARRFERKRRTIRNLAKLVPPKVRYLPPAYLAVTGQLERFQPVIREAA